MKHLVTSVFRRLRPGRAALASLPILLACLVIPERASGAFGLSTNAEAYAVDTGAGLVFKVRRTEGPNPNHQSPGDIMSLVYNGVEYQDQLNGSQINSGFDWLGYSNTTVNVSAEVVNANYVKVTVVTADLIHYYIARNGSPHIYMATYFDVEPVTGGALCRYIVRIPYSLLPNGPEPSDLSGTTFTVESGDIFGRPDGETRSKHYSNHRLLDWLYTGATGNGVGLFMVRDSQEGGSGGPFYRSLINQGGGDQEITYIINYGEVQTEPFRTGILNGPYALVFTDGRQPDPNIDTSWIDSAGLNLTGWVPESGRGAVSGTASGIPDGFETVIGFANANAQYWTQAGPDGMYVTPPMIPGAYTATLYKQELEVATAPVTVTAGVTNTLDLVSAEATPSFIWRLGDWDGTPAGFVNADKVTTMHPSDVRMDDWNLGTFVVGTSTPKTGIPCYQWKDIGGGSQSIQFQLTAAQVVNTVVRVGVTVAYANARPKIEVNSWASSNPPIPDQPDTRSLTVGSYRGNNTTYSFSVPASALVVGMNTLRVYPISGSGLSGFLSAGYSLDCIEWDGAVTTPPSSPTGLNATSGDAWVMLDWDPVPSATHYIVTRSTISDGPYTVLSENVGPAHYRDSTATNGPSYFYRVTAVNAAGTGTGFAQTSVTPSHLLTHLKFDESSGTTASDAVGGNDGTLASGASWTGGQIDNAVQLDGTTNGYVELPDGLVETLSDFTIATWVRPTSTPTWSRVFDFGSGINSYMFLTFASDSGTVRFAITTASGAGEQVLEHSGGLSSGAWHHLAVTLSGTTGTLYIDGSAVDGGTIPLSPGDLGLTRQDYIGKSQWGDPCPTTKVDDFRIYNRALSSSEVSILASLTPPGAPVSLSAGATNDQVTLSWPASSGATSYNVRYSSTSGGPYDLLSGGLTGTSFTYTSTQAGTNYYVVSAVNIAGESTNGPEAHAVVELPHPPVQSIAYYRFEEGTAGAEVPVGGNAVTDSIGGDDNMNAFSSAVAPNFSSLVPIAIIPQTGESNHLSTFYDGGDDLYTALSGPVSTMAFSNFTVEAYVYLTGLSGWQTIVGRDDSWTVGDGGQDGNLQALFYLSKSGINNAFRVEVSTVGGDLLAVEGSVIATTGTWYHLAAVGDVSAGTLTLYVNGVNAGSVAGFDGLFDPAEDNAWTIGRGQYDGAVADNVTGYIDEVRISASALLPGQFLNAFNPDTDNDGLADAWEMANFGNLDQTGTDDPDGDGADNATEEANGTDPNISSIPPRIAVSIDGRLMSLYWPSNNTGWILEYRTNVLDGTWVTIPDSDTNNVFNIDLDAAPYERAFFHLVYP